jgi:PIG-X / PBN1
MRERVTYVLRKGEPGFNPDQIETTKTSLAISNIEAIKEHHIVVSSSEIPSEIFRVLRNCHELHIRWSKPKSYDLVAPYISRVAPGLHVSFTPLQDRSAKRLCTLLKDFFGQRLKCGSVDSAFTTPPILSGRFASTASRQYFYYLPSLSELSLYIQKTICGEDGIPCRMRADDLQQADVFDIDYDALSQSLTLKAIWTKGNGDDGKWYETHLKGSGTSDTLEVGVLINEPPLEEEELRYSGFLTQVGKDSTPGESLCHYGQLINLQAPVSTMFSFPSRHHPLVESDAFTFKAFFSEPTGLHPTLTVSFSKYPPPPSESCALHAYFTFPSYIFLDQYPFTDPLFLQTHHLRALHAISGATDLEAPEWVVPTWGSAALLELAVPEEPSEETSQHSKSSSFHFTLPLHLRYLTPLNASHVLAPVPYPAVFYACPSENSGTKFAASPFDRSNLGYDGLFGSNTLFYHVPPAEGVNAVEMVSVPVLDLRASRWVEMGTVVTVVVGTAWLLWVLARGVWSGKKNDGPAKPSGAKKGGKKKE